MCGRYSLENPGQLKPRFKTSNEISELKGDRNIAPTKMEPVITRNSPNKIELMKWSYIPSWSKDGKMKYKTFNARADRLEESMFKKSLKSQRCLVPASCFYEWKHEGKKSTPYKISLKDKDIFAFAGLYDVWKDSQGNELKSYTIITTEPNVLMKDIHDRMPVILHEEDEDEWVNSENQDWDKLSKLLKPYPAGLMEAVALSESPSKYGEENSK